MEHRIRGAGLLIENDAILLVKIHDFTGEYWIPPGGGFEAGDRSTKACVQREFLEEAGIDVEVGELICVREFLEHNPQRYHAEFFYVIDSYRGTPHIDNLKGLNDEEAIQSVAWVPLDKLPTMRLYPKELQGPLIERVQQGRFSTHLGSYIQGNAEEVNHL
ncbi:NUDIX domain-containing protein [Vibrio sp. Vb2880]|uniref:NUDIX domain-containing protein n=1 Tax=Vibrio TaxID=662 RepID=UPI0013030725|nr:MULTISPECIES: NUDIX domain-containing protein [Vibrio]EKO3999825.1 NUDIX domain-containing protein [Vibrio fluvialis]MBO0212497.1 NUDIX domain-containing protein [Vibrio sp. Vb2880]MCG6218682.1 NUDIX domain-containing protein [Vibrio furnissii]MCG6228079.1 NUDIX domain-containing protein [Vibrio furnissii]MCG6268949.1 NUDIX domain-containing protein [Vibrio furnissii]